jgi:hypothetical protein
MSTHRPAPTDHSPGSRVAIETARGNVMMGTVETTAQVADAEHGLRTRLTVRIGDATLTRFASEVVGP